MATTLQKENMLLMKKAFYDMLGRQQRKCMPGQLNRPERSNGQSDGKSGETEDFGVFKNCLKMER